jgi:hypothetical protein
MTKANNHTQQQDDSWERMPAMSKEEADAEIRQLGVSQEQIDMDISHLDPNDFVDPKYLPAIAAKMLREGKMLNFKNPRVVNNFARIVDEAFEETQAKADRRKANKEME